MSLRLKQVRRKQAQEAVAADFAEKAPELVRLAELVRAHLDVAKQHNTRPVTSTAAAVEFLGSLGSALGR